MNELEIRFRVSLVEQFSSSFFRNNGPLFHRWLPRGKEDAIKISFDDSDTHVELWFERRGYMDDGMIKFAQDREEIDESVIPRQAILDGGRLFGSVTFNDLPEEEIRSVMADDQGAEPYIALGKRVVKKYVVPTVIKFARILRDDFGQYWIEIPAGFDSRKRSLGSYCGMWSMKWLTPDGREGLFTPTERIGQALKVTVDFGQTYEEYIDEMDWDEIGTLLSEGYEPSIHTTVARSANGSLDKERLDHALIECVTALELAVEEYVRRKITTSRLKAKSESFWQLPLPTRVTMVGALADLDRGDIESTLMAIEARNRLVHDGLQPGPESEASVVATLELIRGLSGVPHPRFPTANPGNALRDDWANPQGFTAGEDNERSHNLE